VVVAPQRPGQKAGLAQYLEAVADADDQTAVSGETLYCGHNRREPGYGPGPQIVAVGKSPRQYHALVLAEVFLLVPNVVSLLTEQVPDYVMAVGIAPSTGENNYTETHGTSFDLKGGLLPVHSIPEGLQDSGWSGIRRARKARRRHGDSE
jgi:hypothetical protein